MASVTVAYILWLFGGIFGLHHLYLRRHGQALIWWLSWGGYVLGWLGDSGRIVGYVAEANETREEKREKLKVLKKHTPKPEINFVTVGSYFMCGHLLSSLITNAVPEIFLKAAVYGPFLTHASVTLGTSLGVYLISRSGPVQTSFLWPWLAAMSLFPVTYIFPDKRPITIILTTAVGAYFSMECAKWDEDVIEEDGYQHSMKRLMVVFLALMLHGSLWSSFLYFNVTVMSMNGTMIPLRTVMYNFVVTKPFEQTHNALMDLYPCMRMYNLDTCQAHFMRALTEASDPTREDWAFKILAFEDANPTPRKIHSHCRKLSSKFHPDRHQNVKGDAKKEIEARFLEIQQACGILNKIKVNRERRSTWSVSGMDNWHKDGVSEPSNENDDLENGDLDNEDLDYKDLDNEDLDNEYLDNEDLDDKDLDKESLDNEDLDTEDSDDHVLANANLNYEDVNNEDLDNKDLDNEDTNNENLDNEDLINEVLDNEYNGKIKEKDNIPESSKESADSACGSDEDLLKKGKTLYEDDTKYSEQSDEL